MKGIDRRWTRIRSDSLILLDQYNTMIGIQERIDLLEMKVSEITATVKLLIAIYRKQEKYSKILSEVRDGKKVGFYQRKLLAYGANLEANLVLDIPVKIKAQREILIGCKKELEQANSDLKAARAAHSRAVSLSKQLKIDLAERMRMRMTATDTSLDEKWATFRFHSDKVSLEYLMRFMEQGILQCDVNLLFTLGFTSGKELHCEVLRILKPLCHGDLKLSWGKLYHLTGAGVRELTIVEADNATRARLKFLR